MKRKALARRPVFLGALALAMVTCISLSWWEIWLVVAYERKLETPWRLRGTDVIRKRRDLPEVGPYLIPYYSKRFRQLPGPATHVNPHTCGNCYMDFHKHCLERWFVAVPLPDSQKGGKLDVGASPWPDEYLEESGLEVHEFVNACTCPTCSEQTK